MYTISIETFDYFKKAYQNLTSSIYGKGKTIGDLNSDLEQAYVVSTNSDKQIVSCCIYYPKTEMSYENKKVVCFGYFESLDDPQSVKSLVKYLTGKVNKAQQILFAPINGNTWNQYRLSLNSDQIMFPMDIANPPYYSALLKEAGFEMARNYASHRVTSFNYDQEQATRKMEKLKSVGVSIRNIDLDQFDSELDQVYNLCISSFKNSFLFSPIKKETFKKKYLQQKSYIQEDYIWMAVDSEDQLVGMMFALSFLAPDGSKAYIAKTLARLPDRRYAGIGTVLSGLLQKKAIKDECSFGVNAFMEEDNVSNVLSTKVSGKKAKSYALYRLSK